MLNAPQSRALVAILSENSIEAAARSAKLSKGTLYKYLKCPAFKSELETAQQELYTAALFKLKSATSKAVAILIGLLDSDDEGQQRMSAKTILEFAFRSQELNLDDRIAALEEVVRQNPSERLSFASF